MEPTPKPVMKMDPPAEHNRRHFGRISPYWVKCDRGYVLDISANGMKLLTTSKLKSDTVELRLWDSKAGLQVTARVCWRRRIRFRQHEAGLQFVGLDDELTHRLSEIAALFHEYPV